ncbi:hypothetical protein F4813DRAFT_352143 [Daldinia decipiens]|uniref:uncharacterized protein n=1 Tax=Daldinia decipiens TaxID=326647 RepID=UPI0020C3E776|nr:uncharacterized protein F4813DRAFT_352143 [Daldinia decipiens]KAI1659846.1 hypothetical protein F4813DRAFT_352143 [Daldinia decipiens]
MTINAFHLFPFLPAEIRHEVFFLATPHRIVHISQHHEDIDDFFERFDDLSPWQVKLDPSLAYLARNWRERILSYKDLWSQMKLDFYGFTTSRPVQRPWEPSQLTPEIPVPWLFEHHQVAYELLRKSYIYSKAPVPALLHTCVESRRVLINAGYQLAFASRNHGPRTWFNFKNDVLCLKYYGPRDNINLLDNGPWGTGNIDTQSLQQVRKLAIDIAPPLLISGYEYDTEDPALSTIRLLPRLEKIYVIEWDLSLFDDHLVRKSTRPSTPDAGTEREPVSYGREPWRFIPVEEVDSLLGLTVQYPYWRYGIGCMGYNARSLANFEGPTGEYFSHVREYTKNCIRLDMDSVAKEESVAPYQVPEVEFGHIFTEAGVRRLFNDRQEVWRQYNLSINGPKPINETKPINGTRPPLPRPVTPTDLYWQDDWDAFDEAHYSYHHVETHPADYLLRHRKVCQPRRELLTEP